MIQTIVTRDFEYPPTLSKEKRVLLDMLLIAGTLQYSVLGKELNRLNKDEGGD